MATKKHKAGHGARTRKKTARRAVESRSAPKTKSALGAAKAVAGLDLDPLSLKPIQADKAAALERGESRVRSAGQAGSLQGLSDLPGAASESVDELLEEGNALEAAVVEGVEDAPDADQGEIRTREVPEDDVPGEYLDNEA